jgi:hypothetical protein
VAFASSEAGADNEVTVWEFDGEMRQLAKTKVVLPGAAFAFLHDFAITDKSYIFLENPVRLDPWKMATQYMFGKACIAECLAYDTSRQAKVHVVPRPGRAGGAPPPPGGPAAALRTYAAPAPFFSFHHANAFEAGDGRLVVDTVALHEGMDFRWGFERTNNNKKHSLGFLFCFLLLPVWLLDAVCFDVLAPRWPPLRAPAHAQPTLPSLPPPPPPSAAPTSSRARGTTTTTWGAAPSPGW